MNLIKKLKSKRIILVLILIAILLFINFSAKKLTQSNSQLLNKSLPWWKVQSIDTMKYSRDLSREKLNDGIFDQVIEEQVKNISRVGATHVAIATPYDSEFLPFLERWVKAARKHDLNVWFRGNWSGWEGWFEYPKITREEHLEKTKEFISRNNELFEDGDIFTACPECENGGPGDPRQTKDVDAHRQFLIKEYQITRKAFNETGKKVRSNFNSMNGDVAKLIMNQETTRALGGIVVIDHYVSSVNTLIKDIQNIASQTKGQVMLGEFGTPIIDVHGRLSEQEQAKWIAEALNKLSQMPELVGLNYWVNVGGPTQLWNSSGTPRQAVETIRSFYTPPFVFGFVQDQLKRPIANAKVCSSNKSTITNQQGAFQLAYLPAIAKEDPPELQLTITADGFKTNKLSVKDVSSIVKVKLTKEHESLFFKIRKFIHQVFR